MGEILRGDILWADLNPTKGHEQSGHRPILVLSNDYFNKKSQVIQCYKSKQSRVCLF